MAAQFDVLKGVLDLVTGALSPSGNPLTSYEAAIGYPSIGRLQNIAKTGQAAVSIYDRKISKNTTRWNPYIISQTVMPAALTTALSLNRLPPGQTATITLGGSVNVGDAVSALAGFVGGTTNGVVAIGVQNDTLATMAQKLANLINTAMAGVLTAIFSGPVVTITNVSGIGMAIASYAGNGGSQVREIGRRDQQVQVILWAQTLEQRNVMTAALESAIALSEINFGPTLDDGTVARLSYISDYDLEDDSQEDVYRHDFMISLDYPITTTDVLYAVLAPVLSVTVGQWEGESSFPSLDFSNPQNSQFLPGLL